MSCRRQLFELLRCSEPQGTFRYLRWQLVAAVRTAQVQSNLKVHSGTFAAWCAATARLAEFVSGLVVGAVGWNPTQLPVLGLLVWELVAEELLVGIRLSYLFLSCAFIGIGGWSCWLESDSATSLGLVFGLVVEVLLVGIRLSYRSKVYYLDLWLIAVGWNSDSATYPICVSPALCWKPAQRRQLYSSINGGFRRR